jgi:MFS family permease
MSTGKLMATVVLVIAFGLHLSFGTYEVVWSLYMVALGASIAWVGLTFVIFAIPEMVVAPIAGRLVDRRGPIPFVIVAVTLFLLLEHLPRFAVHRAEVGPRL